MWAVVKLLAPLALFAFSLTLDAAVPLFWEPLLDWAIPFGAKLALKARNPVPKTGLLQDNELHVILVRQVPARSLASNNGLIFSNHRLDSVERAVRCWTRCVRAHAPRSSQGASSSS